MKLRNIFSVNSFFFICCLAFLFLHSSCAYILGGRTPQLVQIKKGIPDSAKLYYGGNFMGYAPKKIFIPKNAYLIPERNFIEIKAEGYKTKKIIMTRKIRYGYFVLDLLFLGIPLIGDFATGKIYKPVPMRIGYELEKN